MTGYDGGLGLTQLPRGAEQLQRAEALRLLASVDLGRVVFHMQALPAIRPVNHLVDDGIIIIRCRLTSALSAAVRNSEVVVAYEADALDSRTRTGWSVVVTGLARTVTDPGLIADYEQRLHPWVNHADTVVAIEPEIVTGLRVTG
jgi:hypothetical protein